MSQELVVRVEGTPEPEPETVEETVEELQEGAELWRDALSGVTEQLAGLSQRVEQQGNQSSELRSLVETQRQMISDLMAANQQANQQVLETVSRLLTPPEPVVVVPAETLTETLPVVDPDALVVPPEPERIKRFRGI